MTGSHISRPTTSLHPPSTTQPSAVAQRAQVEGAGLAPTAQSPAVARPPQGVGAGLALPRCGCRAGPAAWSLRFTHPSAASAPYLGFVLHTPPRRSFPSWPPRIQPATCRIRPSWPSDSNGRTNRRIQAAPILAQFQSPSWIPSPQARRSRKNRAKRNETNRIPRAPSPAKAMLAWPPCRPRCVKKKGYRRAYVASDVTVTERW